MNASLANMFQKGTLQEIKCWTKNQDKTMVLQHMERIHRHTHPSEE